MTNKILIWMSCGLIVGSLINAFGSNIAFIQEYLVNGLFHVVGSISINVLKMLVIPLLTFSLVCGVCRIGDVDILKLIGIKSFLLFILTTTLATVLAITTAVIVKPGQGVDMIQFIPDTLLPQSPPL
ncbi:MAG: cation:dicarboxylase symporter family transporter [Thiomicrorhabdus sp.]|nr:cation:dicarboxylase symporter family transporter [Thiomicrorhabdus sp.]